MRKADFKLSIIIPCYNEESNIEHIYQEIQKNIDNQYFYEIIFVNDGSQDNSLSILKNLAFKDNGVKYISFSRNFGHQPALKAGLDHSSGNCVISMDADMQHPPELIGKMIEKWHDGYDVVYTIRLYEEKLPLLKKLTSKLFYKIVNWLSNVKIHEGAADFRLLDRKAVDMLKSLNENNLFIRGLVSWIGFSQTSIEYYPNQRFSGETKYSFKKMINFAASGITSFSIKPLKISIFLGVFIASVSFIYGLYALYIALFTNQAIHGWTSVIVSVLFIGGIQLIMIGVLGEYLGKLFLENKRRPNYIISEISEGL